MDPNPPSGYPLGVRHLTSDEVDLALCRSILYEAFVLGFSTPAAEMISRLVSPEGNEALADAAAVLDSEGGTDLAFSVVRLAVPQEPLSLAALQVSFRQLFGHTVRGAAPPYETEYGEDSLFQPPQEMSDLGGFYQAFGLTLRPSEHERIDHVACECEFMLFLARKEAHALAQADAAMLEETRRATRLFLRDHLGRWAPAFGWMLAREDRGGFYGGLGELLVAFVAHECVRVGVAAGPQLLRLRSTSVGDVPMACGTGEELLQIGTAARSGEPE